MSRGIQFNLRVLIAVALSLSAVLSLDAGLFGCRLGLEDAYRFARGEQTGLR